MKYTIRDVEKRLAYALGHVTNTSPNHTDLITSDAPTKLVSEFIKFVKAKHSVKYDKVNQTVVDNVYKYIEMLHKETVTSEKYKEDKTKRDRLIDKNLRLRRQLELSDDCADRNKFGIGATVWRDESAAIDFEEMKLTGGTSHGEAGYPLIDWDNDWFEKGHMDANISEAEVDKYEEELVALLRVANDSIEAAWVELNLKLNKVKRTCKIAKDTVRKFKLFWVKGDQNADAEADKMPTKDRIENLKKEVFRVRILSQQIQAVDDDNQAMEHKVLAGGDSQPFYKSLPQWGEADPE